MKTQHIMLLVAGILGILAFFFPFLQFLEARIFDIHLFSIKISGWQYVEAILDHYEVIHSARGRKLASFLQDMWLNAEGWKEMLSFALIIYILLGPIVFFFQGLGYVMEAFAKASYRSGMVFLITYTFIAWLAFHYLGKQHHIEIDFFKRANWGYWLGVASILLAAISTFFQRFD